MRTIEKGHPIPGAHTTSGRKYPFAEMQVGDSFLVDSEADRNRAMCAAASHTCTRAGQRKRFVSRKQANGFRIWRTE